MKKHEWAVIAALSITEDEIIQAHTAGDPEVSFGPDRVLSITPPTCISCELPWVEVHNQPCAGDPREARAAMELELEARAWGKDGE